MLSSFTSVRELGKCDAKVDSSNYIIFTDVLLNILPYFNSRAYSMSNFFKITFLTPPSTPAAL